jgi:uncharacterized protein (TIGR02246 family)
MAPEDHLNIQHLFSKLAERWNEGNAEAFAGLFAEDADYIDFTGTYSHGRQAIERLHHQLFQGPLKGSRLMYEGALNIRSVQPDVAIVVARGAAEPPAGSPVTPDRYSINTSVLIKRAGQWIITAFQNNRVQPIPMPNAVS